MKYLKWAARKGDTPLSPREMAPAFANVFDRLGISVEAGQAIGITFKAEARAA